jgi:hypothetical protein
MYTYQPNKTLSFSRRETTSASCVVLYNIAQVGGATGQAATRCVCIMQDEVSALILNVVEGVPHLVPSLLAVTGAYAAFMLAFPTGNEPAAAVEAYCRAQGFMPPEVP